MYTTFTPIPSHFWRRPQTQAICQAGTETALIAVYLLTNAHANRLGIYYLPLSYASIDTQLPLDTVSNALNTLITLQFCQYDTARAYIWVCDMAQYRIGTRLHPHNNQIKHIQHLWSQLDLELPFLEAFYNRYGSCFHLPKTNSFAPPSPPLASPSKPPSNPLRSKENKKEKKNNKNNNKKGSGKPDNDRVKIMRGAMLIADPPAHPISPERSATPSLTDAQSLLDFLNRKTGHAYRPVDLHLTLILDRLREGATLTQCRQIIAKKTRAWKDQANMRPYLRPATLFHPSKFEQYRGELSLPPNVSLTDDAWALVPDHCPDCESPRSPQLAVCPCGWRWVDNASKDRQCGYTYRGQRCPKRGTIITYPPGYWRCASHYQAENDPIKSQTILRAYLDTRIKSASQSTPASTDSTLTQDTTS